MSNYQIHPRVEPLVRQFELPAELGFGMVKAPIMYRADFNGEWQQGQLIPYGTIEIDPAAKVLHYAQEVFEGMKAYKVGDNPSTLFRPLANLERMNTSAERMCMQSVDQQVFLDGISLMTAYCDSLIPNQSGQSLYLRPFLFGTRSNLGMGTSDTFTFMVIASPSEIYHSGHMRVKIERSACRAARGGTGAAKTGGNYAAALQSAQRIKSQGFDQSLWLDPVNMKNIEELSGMNLFFKIDEQLHTPVLNGTFLNGITRMSIIDLARDMGVEVIERDIDIAEILEGIKSKQVAEIFACGTAAIISPVSLIADDAVEGNEPVIFELAEVDVLAEQLRNRLLAIQESRAADKFGWVETIKPEFYPV